MLWFIIRLLLPYMGRFAAGKAADYLQQRRDKRLTREQSRAEYFQTVTGVEIDRPDCPPCPPCPPCPTDTIASTPTTQSVVASRVWFSLSGLLLGGVVGVIGYLLLKDDRTVV
jgi:hypothetical protein